MENSSKLRSWQSDAAIIFDGIRAALAKFPGIRNPVTRARIFGWAPTLAARPGVSGRPRVPEKPALKARRIKRELLDAGVTVYGLLKSESRYLPKVIHDTEHIEAVIYGRHNSSSALMAATDERIIYLDKKPMVELFDEVSYEVISGIEFDIHTLSATVILHTPVKNYNFEFVNLNCAEKFVKHIENQRLEREPKDRGSEARGSQANQGVLMPAAERGMNDMAGYYWLPSDEEERQRIFPGG